MPNVFRGRRYARRLAIGGGVLSATLTVAACSVVRGPFVWVDQYALGQPSSGAYTIGIGDLLNVQVWDNDKMSTRTRVRVDGRISMPLVNDVDAAAKTPTALARDVEAALRDGHFVLNPRVNIVVEESRPIVVPVLGNVAHPGNYPLEAGSALALAIASAGGLNDFAHEDRVFVARKTPTPVRIRFSMRAITAASGQAPFFRLQSGDVVVVQ